MLWLLTIVVFDIAVDGCIMAVVVKNLDVVTCWDAITNYYKLVICIYNFCMHIDEERLISTSPVL